MNGGVAPSFLPRNLGSGPAPVHRCSLPGVRCLGPGRAAPFLQLVGGVWFSASSLCCGENGHRRDACSSPGAAPRNTRPGIGLWWRALEPPDASEPHTVPLQEEVLKRLSTGHDLHPRSLGRGGLQGGVTQAQPSQR